MNQQLELDPSLNCLPEGFVLKGSHIHLLGIGGVAMASLAGLLVSAGARVTGSDQGIYSPANEILAKLDLKIYEGYGPESLAEDPSLVVVGNVVTRQFPVVKTLKERNFHYLSLPQVMNQFFLDKSKNLVVAGCHGKTTSTNIAVKAFQEAGFSPGYLIGGLSLDLDRPYGLGHDYFIIEGDEYDSAFFNKVPKFIHYRPYIVILTSVDFDHADIYADQNAVKAAYLSLVELLPVDGCLVAFGDDPKVREVASQANSRVIYYGQNDDNDVVVKNIVLENLEMCFDVYMPDGAVWFFRWQRPGIHNCLNAAAVAAALYAAGGNLGLMVRSLSKLRGVRRRQEFLGRFGKVVLIDDFAHHPKAVSETLAAIRSFYPSQRIMAIFEPRSNTSRRAIFQNEYAQSFKAADLVFLAAVNQPEKAPEGDRLDIYRLKSDIGTKAVVCANQAELLSNIMSSVADEDVVVLMSNGDFGGLAAHLIIAFNARFQGKV